MCFAMLMHHPQVLEGSRPPDIAAHMDADERAALARMDLVIATSAPTADALVAEYHVPPERIVTAVPGTDRQPASAGSGGPGVEMLSIGSVIPRKRHELIVEALAGLSDLSWRLTIVGNTDRSADHAGLVRRLAAEPGIAGRVRLEGEMGGPDLDALWQAADIYVAASRHEGFGMAVAEALARGVPVGGKVGRGRRLDDPAASILVEPDDAAPCARSCAVC